jgi:general secretion pathway protein G
MERIHYRLKYRYLVISNLIIVVAMVTFSACSRSDSARETELRENLILMRTAIDDFSVKLGRSPKSLSELVEYGYFKELPIDPITGKRDTWKPVFDTPHDGGTQAVVDVRSGAEGRAKDGTRYESW